jgi:D-amino-acid dehydrogenase
MHVAVLGAGVVGVTTAHYLSAAGHEVTVVDREQAVAQCCSYANGAQLSYSYTDAMATPAFLARIPGLVAGLDAGIRVRPPVERALLRWGLAFLGECTTKKALGNTLANLQLAQRSEQLLAELRPQLGVDFAYRNAGKLVLLHGAKELADAHRSSALKAEHGVRTDVISIDDACDIEPGIRHMMGQYSGAVYSPGDDVGDAHAFTVALADQLSSQPHCNFQLGTTIDSIVADKQKVQALNTNHGLIDVDAVVVCLGSWSPQLLRPLGISPLIYPARGYSVTLNPGPSATSVSVTDFARRFVISRTGDQVRIAGFADFVGFSSRSDSRRVKQLTDVASRYAPQAADYESQADSAWAGLRPLTPDGRPLIGATKVNGLYLNTGHGSLGWTLACASAEKVTAAVGRESPSEKSLAA